MWVRSQERDILKKITNAWIKPIELKNGGYEYLVLSTANDSSIVLLGTYSTEEKAIKALDDIQFALESLELMFQMPQNSEVE